MEKRGAIFAPEAYALGKMLDHSDWMLPRGSLPSDIDICFDNNGRIIFCELSSSASEWSDISGGQRWLYESAIRNTRHCAVIARHNVQLADGRQINSKNDIASFQIMFHDGVFLFSAAIDGKWWCWFVEHWFADAQKTWREMADKCHTRRIEQEKLSLLESKNKTIEYAEFLPLKELKP